METEHGSTRRPSGCMLTDHPQSYEFDGGCTLRSRLSRAFRPQPQPSVRAVVSMARSTTGIISTLCHCQSRIPWTHRHRKQDGPEGRLIFGFIHALCLCFCRYGQGITMVAFSPHHVLLPAHPGSPQVLLQGRCPRPLSIMIPAPVLTLPWPTMPHDDDSWASWSFTSRSIRDWTSSICAASSTSRCTWRSSWRRRRWRWLTVMEVGRSRWHQSSYPTRLQRRSSRPSDCECGLDVIPTTECPL